MIDKYAAQGRIHFMHVRNVKILPDGGFEESAHFSACGSLDIVRILDILHRHRFNGYLRPDHGRMIWGETAGPATACTIGHWARLTSTASGKPWISCVGRRPCDDKPAI